MTPKEKAEDLVIKFLKLYNKEDGYVVIQDHTIITPKNAYHISHFANCALIAVEEISDVLWEQMADKDRIIYWEDVKHEIEKL